MRCGRGSRGRGLSGGCLGSRRSRRYSTSCKGVLEGSVDATVGWQNIISRNQPTKREHEP